MFAIFRWSHTAAVMLKSSLWGGQSMALIVLRCEFFYAGMLSLHWQCVCDHCHAVMHSYFYHFWQDLHHHWLKCCPKPWQSLHHISVGAVGALCFPLKRGQRMCRQFFYSWLCMMPKKSFKLEEKCKEFIFMIISCTKLRLHHTSF